MTGRGRDRSPEHRWQPLAPGDRFELAEGSLWRANEATEEDVRAVITGLDAGVRIECRSARSGVWLVARRRGALGTPRATLSWLSAEALATSVPQRRSDGRLSRALRDPRDGTVRTFEEDDHVVLWLVVGATTGPEPDLSGRPFRWVSARHVVDVTGEVMLLSGAGGDEVGLWIDPPGCARVAATREPVAAPVPAAAGPRVARVAEARSLDALCDALAEGGHRAFVLRHRAGGGVEVVGDAPRGRWSLPGADSREGDLDGLAGLPRRAPLLCLVRDRSPWAALQAAYGDERVSLVYPLPPDGVDLSLDGEISARFPALLQPHPRAAFTPWNELPMESIERRLLVGADGVAWAQYAAQVAALARAQGERLHASDVASLALEQARRSARAPRPGELADLLHALALDWFDESLSANVAAAELVSTLAHLGRQRLSAHGVTRAVRAAMRCPADPRDDGQLPELVRALRVQAKAPVGDLDACAALAMRLAKDKRFKGLTIVGRIVAALSPSRAAGGGRPTRRPPPHGPRWVRFAAPSPVARRRSPVGSIRTACRPHGASRSA